MMHRLSRYLFIFLMLALLPLRGWAGNSMAIDMAAMTVAQSRMAGMAGQSSMSADCIMQSQAPSDDVAAQSCSCETCELCLAVADLTPAQWAVSSLIRHSSPLALSTSFTSAASPANFKPPIF